MFRFVTYENYKYKIIYYGWFNNKERGDAWLAYTSKNIYTL